MDCPIGPVAGGLAAKAGVVILLLPGRPRRPARVGPLASVGEPLAPTLPNPSAVDAANTGRSLLLYSVLVGVLSVGECCAGPPSTRLHPSTRSLIQRNKLDASISEGGLLSCQASAPAGPARDPPRRTWISGVLCAPQIIAPMNHAASPIMDDVERCIKQF